jgi:uncharacterized lipoprotein
MRAAPAILVVALLLTGCGGGSEPEQVVREFAQALEDSDGEKLCEELVTREYAEQITLAQGDGAREQCKKQLDVLRGGRFEVVKVLEVKEDGDEATVRAEIEQAGQRRPQVFRLVKEDGQLRLAGPAS